MKKIFITIFYIVLIFFTSSSTEANNVIKQRFDNPSFLNKEPAPHTLYQLLYVINANQGIISIKPAYDYQLILIGLHPTINYKIHANKSGIIPTSQFIKAWEKHFKNKKDILVEADISGVINENSNQQIPFYKNIKLGHPEYNRIRNEIIFNIILKSNEPLNKTIEKFDNATLFINGCQVCSCTENPVQCIDN